MLNNTIDYLHLESDNAALSPVEVTLEFQLVDSANGVININSTLELKQIGGVVDGLGNDRTSEFEVISGTTLPNSFKIRCKSNQIFLSDARQREKYTFIEGFHQKIQ